MSNFRSVIHQLNIQHSTDRYWIGLSDLAVEGEWRWITGEVAKDEDAHWNSGEPNDNGGTADCADLYLHYDWNTDDVPCDRLRYALCEIRNVDC